MSKWAAWRFDLFGQDIGTVLTAELLAHRDHETAAESEAVSAVVCMFSDRLRALRADFSARAREAIARASCEADARRASACASRCLVVPASAEERAPLA